jgi:hypothetical protein
MSTLTERMRYYIVILNEHGGGFDAKAGCKLPDN